MRGRGITSPLAIALAIMTALSALAPAGALHAQNNSTATLTVESTSVGRQFFSPVAGPAQTFNATIKIPVDHGLVAGESPSHRQDARSYRLDITVSVVDGATAIPVLGTSVVPQIASPPAGAKEISVPVTATWNGKTAAGALLADGSKVFKVKADLFVRRGRTVAAVAQEELVGTTGPDAGEGSFIYDATVPVLQFTVPSSEGEVLLTSQPELNLSFADPTSGPDRTTLRVIMNFMRPDEFQVPIDPTSILSLSATAPIAPTGRTLSDGDNTAVAEIADRAGNRATIAIGFIVDTLPPTIAIEPADGSDILVDSPLTIRIPYADSGAGVDLSTLMVSINGTNVTSLFTAGPAEAAYTTPGITPPLRAGANTILAAIQDRTGKAASAQSNIVLRRASGGGGDEEPPAVLEIVSGNRQQSFMGRVLMKDLVVKANRPGVPIAFRATVGTGIFLESRELTEITNEKGLAGMRFLGAPGDEPIPIDDQGSFTFGVKIEAYVLGDSRVAPVEFVEFVGPIFVTFALSGGGQPARNCICDSAQPQGGGAFGGQIPIVAATAGSALDGPVGGNLTFFLREDSNEDGDLSTAAAVGDYTVQFDLGAYNETTGEFTPDPQAGYFLPETQELGTDGKAAANAVPLKAGCWAVRLRIDELAFFAIVAKLQTCATVDFLGTQVAPMLTAGQGQVAEAGKELGTKFTAEVGARIAVLKEYLQKSDAESGGIVSTIMGTRIRFTDFANPDGGSDVVVQTSGEPVSEPEEPVTAETPLTPTVVNDRAHWRMDFEADILITAKEGGGEISRGWGAYPSSPLYPDLVGLQGPEVQFVDSSGAVTTVLESSSLVDADGRAREPDQSSAFRVRILAPAQAQITPGQLLSLDWSRQSLQSTSADVGQPQMQVSLSGAAGPQTRGAIFESPPLFVTASRLPAAALTPGPRTDLLHARVGALLNVAFDLGRARATVSGIEVLGRGTHSKTTRVPSLWLAPDESVAPQQREGLALSAAFHVRIHDPVFASLISRGGALAFKMSTEGREFTSVANLKAAGFFEREVVSFLPGSSIRPIDIDTTTFRFATFEAPISKTDGFDLAVSFERPLMGTSYAAVKGSTAAKRGRTALFGQGTDWANLEETSRRTAVGDDVRGHGGIMASLGDASPHIWSGAQIPDRATKINLMEMENAQALLPTADTWYFWGHSTSTVRRKFGLIWFGDDTDNIMGADDIPQLPAGQLRFVFLNTCCSWEDFPPEQQEPGTGSVVSDFRAKLGPASVYMAWNGLVDSSVNIRFASAFWPAVTMGRFADGTAPGNQFGDPLGADGVALSVQQARTGSMNRVFLDEDLRALGIREQVFGIKADSAESSLKLSEDRPR